MEALVLSYLRKRATLRGPLGGSRGWTTVWAVLLGVRLLRRLTKPKPEIAFSQTLRPGESLLISGDGREPRIIGGTTP
jgi:hypothetical protein